MSRNKPRVPDGVRVYAIGDIHGCADLLDQTLGRIDLDLTRNPVATNFQIFLGDYIDRGPASREVVDRLVVRHRLHPTIFLKGNHETYVTSLANNPSILEDWQRFGGFETLMSYGIVPDVNSGGSSKTQLAAAFGRVLPASHRHFFNNLTLSFTCGDFFFVHAGVRPGITLADQSEQDLLWIRQDFLCYEEKFSKVIVHGHTPVLEPDIRPNRINIDTGAYATGRLTCLRLQNDSIDFV